MRIFYLCPEYDAPVGGVAVIYRHVEILNKNGIPAFVLHSKRGYCDQWFYKNTPIAYIDNSFRSRALNKLRSLFSKRSTPMIRLVGKKNAAISRNDIIAVPENLGPAIDSIGPGIKKVILNQNCYYTFHGYSLLLDRLRTPYTHPDTLALLVNSDDGERYLNYAFPRAKTKRFFLSIDENEFYFCNEKENLITYFPRKNLEDARQVINLLKFRGTLGGFDIQAIDNVARPDVARLLRKSKIFLSFGHPEGFGLPAAEAMACGCFVIGYHGGGGKEFFYPEFSDPIAVGDIIGFSSAVEDAIKRFTQSEDDIHLKGQLASNFIRANYSLEHEDSSLTKAWKSIIQGHPRL